MTRLIMLVLLLFLLGCNEATPVDAKQMDSEFISARGDCLTSTLVWLSVVRDVPSGRTSAGCGAWLERVGYAANAMDLCWSGLPVPADKHLKKGLADALDGIAAYQRFVTKFGKYCDSTDGDPESALRELDVGTEAIMSSTVSFDKYQP